MTMIGVTYLRQRPRLQSLCLSSGFDESEHCDDDTIFIVFSSKHAYTSSCAPERMMRKLAWEINHFPTVQF